MEAVTVKFSPQLRARLAREATRRSVTQSAVIREAVEAALGEQEKAAGQPSCADLVRDLIGSVSSGQPDLATNKSLLEAAMLRDLGGRQRRR